MVTSFGQRLRTRLNLTHGKITQIAETKPFYFLFSFDQDNANSRGGSLHEMDGPGDGSLQEGCKQRIF